MVSRLSDGHWHMDDLFVHALRDALLELFRSLWLCHRLESDFHDLRYGHAVSPQARRRSRNCCSTGTSPPVSSTEGGAQCLNKHLPRLCHGHSSPCQHSGTIDIERERHKNLRTKGFDTESGAPSGVTSEATQHCCENNCHNIHYHDQAKQTVKKDIW